METYSDPSTTACPKCKQEGFMLDYHGPGVRGCKNPMFCRADLDHGTWENDPEHIVMTCETCGYRVRKGMDYFENGR